jgi:hypothetical protein
MSSLIGLIFIVGFFLIIFLKRHYQLGKTWDGPVAAKVRVNNNYLTCHVCKFNFFQKREGLLNTTFLTLFQLGYFNKSATCYACVKCGHIHWFDNKDQEVEIVNTQESKECETRFTKE